MVSTIFMQKSMAQSTATMCIIFERTNGLYVALFFSIPFYMFTHGKMLETFPTSPRMLAGSTRINEEKYCNHSRCTTYYVVIGIVSMVVNEDFPHSYKDGHKTDKHGIMQKL